ncbi:MAG TPA: penicillin-binding protein 2 [Patescibacteria group bacterium]|nr:penicillin-binding protein 2 [Patescibacteria group bacterium]
MRSFYLEVIKHDYYQKAALSGQLKQYEIPGERGVIEVHSGNGTQPLVLNEKLYTLYADPKFIKDPKNTAVAIAGTVGGKAEDIENKLKTPDTRYVILAKKLTKEQKDKVTNSITDEIKQRKKDHSTNFLWKGIGTQETNYRTYPNGQLAAQLLGFVNDDGEGKYGIEQALDGNLKGTPGKLKAITDANGVPLAANRENIIIEPKAGDKLLLTIDIGMQQQLEDILKSSLDAAHSRSGGAVIMDVNTGAVKAMANYPTYNPADFYNVKDAADFNNSIVSDPLEVGSIMKPLTFAAAMQTGHVSKESTYNDPGGWVIDGITVKNVEGENQPGKRTIYDILQMSLNTGATWLLMQMGGGEINQKARTTWYDYLTNHYQFGKKTGIEQGYEAPGTVPAPDQGFGLNITYANMAFGQGMSTTSLQIAAAYASVLNGGVYYKPRLVDKIISSSGRESDQAPVIIKRDVVSPKTSQTVRELMQYVVARNYLLYKVTKPRTEFMIGGKTGTAQIHQPNDQGGGYYKDKFNGTFVGFVGGDQPQYVIVVRVNEPHVSGYAGAGAAAPFFGKLSNMLINNSYVTPKN